MSGRSELALVEDQFLSDVAAFTEMDPEEERVLTALLKASSVRGAAKLLGETEDVVRNYVVKRPDVNIEWRKRQHALAQESSRRTADIAELALNEALENLREDMHNHDARVRLGATSKMLDFSLEFLRTHQVRDEMRNEMDEMRRFVTKHVGDRLPVGNPKGTTR
jgi:hypothetical protein